MAALESELTFFISNQNDLVSKYGGKILVIKDQRVVGVYDEVLEAYLKAKKQYELGTFIIQPCLQGEDAYTVHISTLDFSHPLTA